MSRKKAIDDYCRWCICDEKDKGTWRQQVGACKSVECPLWRYRPLPSVDLPVGSD
jgi:hypothetical protein